MRRLTVSGILVLALLWSPFGLTLDSILASNGDLDHIEITPSVVCVAAGGTQQFIAQGYDDRTILSQGLPSHGAQTSAL